tara:strand:+ start:376 stop:1224 length:849 start_codon:yes stop_codon:yes gene_type:complete
MYYFGLVKNLRTSCYLVFYLFPLLTFAGKEPNTTGARAYGLAGSSILFSDLWSAENNPAGLGFLKEWGAGLSYENQFLQSELATKGAVVAMPTNSGAFGLSVNQFGFSGYSEDKIGLSYGQQLSENFSMGIQINYLSTRIGEGYGSRSAISGNIGMLAKLSEKIDLAAVIINPNSAQKAAFNDERYPTLIKMGLGYTYSKKVRIISEVVKDIDFKTDVKVGMEYQLHEIFSFRMGYATHPSLSSFGFSLNVNQFRMDFASGFDSNLGFSPQVSLSYTPAAKP